MNAILPEDAAVEVRSWCNKLMPYALICLVGLVCHGLILTNDGTLWDGWWEFHLLKTRNWPAMREIFTTGGTPGYFWLYLPFAFAPDIIGAFMGATVIALLATAVLTYRLALRLTGLSRGEALAITLLAQAMPVFSAAQEFMLFFYIFTGVLFLASVHLAASTLEAVGFRHWLFRALSFAGFCLSFGNASLLVFYGGFYILLFAHFLRLRRMSFKRGLRPFLVTFPDLFFVPVVGWLMRIVVASQHGWYQGYNMPGSHLAALGSNLWSFFRNVVPSHAGNVLSWFVDHPVLTIIFIAGAVILYVTAPSNWCVRKGELATAHLAWFGALLLFFSIFPFAAAGKSYPWLPQGESSRACVLTPLPLAVLLFAAIRWILFRREGREAA